MVDKKEIEKGDIYYASLDPIIGSEQSGNRPVVVVQNNIGNKYSPTVLIAPITSKVNSKPIFPLEDVDAVLDVAYTFFPKTAP